MQKLWFLLKLTCTSLMQNSLVTKVEKYLSKYAILHLLKCIINILNTVVSLRSNFYTVLYKQHYFIT